MQMCYHVDVIMVVVVVVGGWWWWWWYGVVVVSLGLCDAYLLLWCRSGDGGIL